MGYTLCTGMLQMQHDVCPTHLGASGAFLEACNRGSDWCYIADWGQIGLLPSPSTQGSRPETAQPTTHSVCWTSPYLSFRLVVDGQRTSFTHPYVSSGRRTPAQYRHIRVIRPSAIELVLWQWYKTSGAYSPRLCKHKFQSKKIRLPFLTK